MIEPFVIFCLPRSRSAWLSTFLSYGDYLCAHDLAPHSDSVEDFYQSLTCGIIGTVETGAVIGWPLIRKRLPESRFLVVRRPVGEVMDSFRSVGVEVHAAEIEEKAELLDKLSGVTGVPTIQFKSLASEACCAWVFKYLLGIEHDREWWQSLASKNIEIDMPQRIRLLGERHDILERMKAEVRDRCVA